MLEAVAYVQTRDRLENERAIQRTNAVVDAIVALAKSFGAT